MGEMSYARKGNVCGDCPRVHQGGNVKSGMPKDWNAKRAESDFDFWTAMPNANNPNTENYSSKVKTLIMVIV